MSILTNIYKQGSTVVSELKGMNKALSDMSKRDKTAYQLDARQRKYEKERDKRQRQDQKKVFQTVTDSVDQKVEQAGTSENKQAKQLQAGLGTAIANAIKGAKKGSPLKQATGGGQGGIAPAGPRDTRTATQVKMDSWDSADKLQADQERRLEELESKVFNFDAKKVQGFQRGGFTGAIPNMGQPSTGDHFYTHVEPGSYVMNRNAVAAMGFQKGGNVPVALEQGEIVIPPGQFDEKVLDYLNYEMFPRFQKGGAPKKLPNNGAKSEDTVAPLGMTQEQYKKVQKKAKGGKIFLHWAGSGYSGASSKYHATVQGDGKVIKTRDYNTMGGGHTYMRNSTGIGISLAAMADGSDSNFGSYPVKPEQYSSMANLVAKIAKDRGWTPANITINNVMTHAEAGSNKDGAAIHDNYGPQPWGGTGERWDLWKLYEKDANGSGGNKIRNMIRSAMGGDPKVEEVSAGTVTNPDTGAGTAGDAQRPAGGAGDITQQVGEAADKIGGFFNTIFKGAFDKVFGDQGEKFGLDSKSLLGMLSGDMGDMGGDIFSGGGGGGDITGGGGGNTEKPKGQGNKELQTNTNRGGGGAPPSIGAAPKSNKPYEIASSIGFSKADWDIYRNVVGDIESGNRYKIQGGSGGKYDGRWQLGAAAKTDAARYLGEPDPGHGGQKSAARQKFVNDSKMQERYFAAFTAKNHQYLSSHPKYANAPAKRKFQILGYAHNQGAGGAKDWLDTGRVGRDGFLTKATKYSKALRAAYKGKQRGGIVNMGSNLGDSLAEFFTHSHTQMEREATADMEPQIINLGSMEGESGPGVAATSLDDNMPLGNLPARDSCPLSIYYRYHPSFNPQGFNP